MLTDKFDGGVWADFGDWVEVVAAKEDAQIDELDGLIKETKEH